MPIKKIRGALPPLIFALMPISVAIAQQNSSLQQMTLIGVFDPGQPSAVILKLYDDNSDIYCYILMPQNAVKREINGAWTYDANNIGSISCVTPNREQINFDIPKKRN